MPLKSTTFKYCGMSVLASVVFYVSYYVGLLYEEYSVFMVVAGGILNVFILSSKSFSPWAEKTGLFACIVLILAALFQSIDMHIYIADLFSVKTEDIQWGTRQLIANCMWFGQAVIDVLISLALTFIASYIESKKIVE